MGKPIHPVLGLPGGVAKAVTGEIRDTCKSCEYFIPAGADIIVALAGEGNVESECKLFINTEKGSELVEDIKGEREEAKLETEKITRIRSLRQNQKEKITFSDR